MSVLHRHHQIEAREISDKMHANHTYENDDIVFMKEQAEIQRHRQNTLRTACQNFEVEGKPKNLTHVVEHPRRFIVDERHNLVYCSIAKVASTNWRQVFLQLAGIDGNNKPDPRNRRLRYLKRKVRTMDDLTVEDGFHLLGDSVTFMFARHPFSRVLSSFRNKLAPDSTFEAAFAWKYNLGLEIINLYRYHEIPNPKRELTVPTPEERRKLHTYDLKFSEFVRYLGDTNMKSDVFFNNIHWCDMNVCDPCNVKYDVIGKLETIETDAKYILKLAKLNGVSFPSPDISQPTYSSKKDTLERYLRDVPAEYIWNLYQRYRLDFALFGYELPPIAAKKIQEWNTDVRGLGYN